MSISVASMTDTDRFWAIDIWTARIKVLLCEIVQWELKIIDRVSIRQSRKNMNEGGITDLQGTADTLMRALAKILETWAPSGEVKSVIFSLASPQLVTDTLSMNYVRDWAATPLEMEEIDTMVAKIEYKSLTKAQPKIFAQVPLDVNQMKLVTTSLSSIVIDGKKVSNPIGFTGTNVSLTVCNIFIPLSTFGLLSSIARKLDLRVISFVPTPIALSKARSDALELFDPNCFIDVWAAITTVALENYSELIGAIQVPVGMALLENMMIRKLPKLTRLEIEHRIHAAEHTHDEEIVFKEFYEILAKSISTAIGMITTTPLLRNFYFSGAAMDERNQAILFPLLRDEYPGTELHTESLLDPKLGVEREFGVAYSLAASALELSRQERDPIARILRFVIYRHE